MGSKSAAGWIWLWLLISLVSPNSIAADSLQLSVPWYVTEELKDRFVNAGVHQVQYKINLPADFDTSKRYPVLLMLSGSGFNAQGINYFHYVYGPKKFFKNAVKIYPVTAAAKPLSELSRDELGFLLDAIIRNERVLAKNWVLVGARLGSQVALELARARPDLFAGFILVPGRFEGGHFPKAWRHYRVVIALPGKGKDTWSKAAPGAYRKLKNRITNINYTKLKGAGDILTRDDDMDLVYRLYKQNYQIKNK